MTTNKALISRSVIDRIIRCNAIAGRAAWIQNDRPKALAAAYLDRDEDDCAFDPLSLTVFKGEDGDFIGDADLAVGGPTIRARYESRWDTLEITASWGNCTVQIYQAAGESSYLKDQLSAFGAM